MLVAGFTTRWPRVAAVCLDGAIVSVVTESPRTARGSDRTDSPAPLVAEALRAAGLDASRTPDAYVDADELPAGLPHPQTVVAAASTEATQSLLVVADERDGAAGVYLRDGQSLNRVGDVPGWHVVMDAAEAVARTLGLPGTPLDALDAVARARSTDEVSDPLRLVGLADDEHGAGVLADVLERAAALSPVPLDDPHTPHRVAQRVRGELASAWFDAAARVVRRAVDHQASPSALDVVIGGSALQAGSLRQRLGADVRCTPLPGPAGDAVGAALAASLAAGMTPRLPASLHLGRAWDDTEVKRVLENCRLDFVYEPSWGRLMDRVSALLERGLVVAWFQGRAEAGAVALGSRGILADASLKFTRDNVNQYLLGRGLAEPLPVSLLASELDRALPGASPAPAGLGRWRGEPVPAWCVAAGEPTGWVSYHTVDRDQSPALHDLLAVHHARTARPGLVNLPARCIGAGDDPREAVAAMFSHAVDALVIGRFVVMKDMWLLRTGLPS